MNKNPFIGRGGRKPATKTEELIAHAVKQIEMKTEPQLKLVLTDYQKDVLLKAYGKLHDGLSEMVEEGRLDEGHIPDDYQWLVHQLTYIATLWGQYETQFRALPTIRTCADDHEVRQPKRQKEKHDCQKDSSAARDGNSSC